MLAIIISFDDIIEAALIDYSEWSYLFAMRSLIDAALGEVKPAAFAGGRVTAATVW